MDLVTTENCIQQIVSVKLYGKGLNWVSTIMASIYSLRTAHHFQPNNSIRVLILEECIPPLYIQVRAANPSK